MFRGDAKYYGARQRRHQIDELNHLRRKAESLGDGTRDKS